MTHLTIPILARAAWCFISTLAAFWLDTLLWKDRI